VIRPALPFRPVRLGSLLAGLLLAAAAFAQIVRPIPETVELGRLAVGVFPQATVDGRPVVLGPGTRIYDENNMIRPPSTVTGERRVAYVRGTLGEINQVWLLSDAEYRAIAARISAARRAAQQR
jgi:hypothetical protein